jgi:hypothetical protein
VISRPFIKKFKKKSGDVNDEASFSFFILLHKRAKPIHPHVTRADRRVEGGFKEWVDGWRNGWIGGRKDGYKGVYGFSSLMNRNKKAKICFVIYIAGFFFSIFFCYEVIVKQIFYKRSANHY